MNALSQRHGTARLRTGGGNIALWGQGNYPLAGLGAWLRGGVIGLFSPGPFWGVEGAAATENTLRPRCCLDIFQL